MRQVPLRRLYERKKILGHIHEPMLSVYRERGVVLKDEAINNNKTAEDRSIYQLVDNGWLVVNRMKAWQGSLGISSFRGIVSGHYICFEPQHTENHRYLHYALRSPRMTAHFAAISRGVRTGQLEIDNDDLAATAVTLPPVKEQRRIADFLDDRVGRIDRIIASRREQSGLAQASYQSWLDGLMSAYEPIPMRRVLLRIEQGWSPVADSVPAQPGEAGVLKLGAVRAGEFRPWENKAFMAGDLPREEYRIGEGDLLITRANTPALVGDATVVSGLEDEASLYLSDLIYRAHLLNYDPHLASAALRTSQTRQLIAAIARGTSGSMPKLRAQDLGSLVLPAVPVTQQRALGEKDVLVRRNRDCGIRAFERSIELLIEYKTSLITAAVTGELDVTTAGSGIPG